MNEDKFQEREILLIFFNIFSLSLEFILGENTENEWIGFVQYILLSIYPTNSLFKLYKLLNQQPPIKCYKKIEVIMTLITIIIFIIVQNQSDTQQFLQQEAFILVVFIHIQILLDNLVVSEFNLAIALTLMIMVEIFEKTFNIDKLIIFLPIILVISLMKLVKIFKHKYQQKQLVSKDFFQQQDKTHDNNLNQNFVSNERSNDDKISNNNNNNKNNKKDQNSNNNINNNNKNNNYSIKSSSSNNIINNNNNNKKANMKFLQQKDQEQNDAADHSHEIFIKPGLNQDESIIEVNQQKEKLFSISLNYIDNEVIQQREINRKETNQFLIQKKRNSQIENQLALILLQKLELQVVVYDQMGTVIYSCNNNQSQLTGILNKITQEIITNPNKIKTSRFINFLKTINGINDYSQNLKRNSQMEFDQILSPSLVLQGQKLDISQNELMPPNSDKLNNYSSQQLIQFLDALQESNFIQQYSDETSNKDQQIRNKIIQNQVKSQSFTKKLETFSLQSFQIEESKEDDNVLEFVVENLGILVKLILLMSQDSEFYFSIIIEPLVNEKFHIFSQQRYINILSHHFRSPLNCSIGILENLKNSNKLETQIQEKYLQPVIDSSYQQLNSLNCLLDMKAIEINQFEYEIIQVDLRFMAQEIEQLLQFQIHFKNIDLQFQIPSNFEQIWTDGKRFKQVLLNLIGNAIKFSPLNQAIQVDFQLIYEIRNQEQQTPISRKKQHSLCESRQILEVSIQDFGPGIDETNSKQIIGILNNKDFKAQNNRRQLGLGIRSSIHILRGLTNKQNQQNPLKIEKPIEGEGCLVKFYLYNFLLEISTQSFNNIDSQNGSISVININQQQFLFSQLNSNLPSEIEQNSNQQFSSGVEYIDNKQISIDNKFQVNYPKALHKISSNSFSKIILEDIDLLKDQDIVPHDNDDDEIIIPNHSSPCYMKQKLYVNTNNQPILTLQQNDKQTNMLTNNIMTQSENNDKNSQSEKIKNIIEKEQEQQENQMNNIIQNKKPEESSIKVLIVDDNQFNLMTLQCILDDFNIQSDIAMNGQLAIDSFKDQYFQNNGDHYQLILMDIDMPVKNGFEASKEINEFCSEFEITCTIVACTAFISSEDVKTASLCGMKEYLTKPVNPTIIKETIEQYLN